VADISKHAIFKITPAGVASTFVDNTHLSAAPTGLAFDSSGNLYVSSQTANRILKVTPSGVVSTFVDSNSGLDVPLGLAFDSSGNLYVANSGDNRVVKVSSPVVTTGTTQVTIQSSVASRPMQIGGSNNAAVTGINLTSAELATIVTASSGAITIGDSSQTGDIT